MKSLLIFLALLALGMSYLIWLDWGCELNGVMTWQGKVCAESL